jgi:hypothetical protein
MATSLRKYFIYFVQSNSCRIFLSAEYQQTDTKYVMFDEDKEGRIKNLGVFFYL